MTGSLAADRIRTRILEVRSTLPDRVRLVGVTKYKSSDVIRAAYEAGLRDFGESRLPEAIAKQSDLADLDGITWHLIGHLQTNKARKAIEHFDWIHSLDSLRLANKLNQLADDCNRVPTCCLQVKMVPDPPKYGFSVEELWAALPELDQMAHLKIVGLMTIPPLESDLAACERIFLQARDLADQINQKRFDRLRITELSMGMSSDYPAAIAAGSTMIRLGTTLFGDRPA